jgi:alkylation response protein AidB-like acyl-CoA dehydrogenase
VSVAARGRELGLRAVRRLASSERLDRLGARRVTERAIYRASRGGFKAVAGANRSFAAVRKLAQPARQPISSKSKLFDLTPTAEQEMLTEAIGDFATSAMRPAAAEADRRLRTPDELLAQGVELGLHALAIPEELGGVMEERSAVTAALAYEALGRGDMGIAVAILAPAALATALSLWGDADQQSRYLQAFAGERPPVGALALLEDGPLFDPLRPRTHARSEGGDWVLSGEKTLVPRAEEGELFVVGARLPSGSPGLFLVDGASDGLGVRPQPAMGVRAAATARLALEEVRVPRSALLAEGDPGAYAECVQRARIAWCALSVGVAQAVRDYVIPYVTERVAFGEPIANRQAVAFAVADIAIELEGMRLATWRAASRADSGKEFARQAALARALCARQATKIGSEGVQLLGGHGYVKEHPVERWYRDLRGAGVMEGALLL